MNKFNLRYVEPSGFITVCVILGLIIYLSNKYINNHWGISFSVVAITTGVFVLINNYLWNIAPFSWLYCTPDFSGRFEGTLNYEFRNDNSEKVVGELDHIKIIVQNGSDIVVNSWTKMKDGAMSSKSTSIEASIVKEKDGTFTLIYNYLNDGNFELDFSPYYGTEVLKLIKNGNKKALQGKYYTDRLPWQTKGKITLEHKSNNLTHDI